MPLTVNSSSVYYIDTYFEPHQILKLYANQLKTRTAIIHAHAEDTYVPYHAGPTSLKMTWSGQENYQLDRRNYAVNEKQFLILNEGSEYITEIRPDSKTTTFTINFSPSLIAQAVHKRKSSSQTAGWEEYEHSENGGFRFFERLYPLEENWIADIHRIKTIAETRFLSSALELDEALCRIIEKMIATIDDNLIESERLISKKAATRIEVFRRLCYIKDFIQSNYDQDITLAQLSEVGLLSSFYLIRHFKQAFGLTPFGYLMQCRMEKAGIWIKTTSDPIQDICLRLGYSDLSSFSKLFKRYHGLPPSRYRDN
jgi:AraC family transcriptional regulator